MTARRMVVAVALGAAAAGVLAGCASDPASTFDDRHYRSTTVHGESAVQAVLQSAPVKVWFERDDGRLDMIVAGPVNAYTVPVSLSGTTITPDEEHIAATLVGCAGASPGCTVDGWLKRFVTRRMNYSVEGSTLTLSEGAVTLSLERS